MGKPKVRSWEWKPTRPSGSQVLALKQNVSDEGSFTPTKDTSDLNPLDLAREGNSGESMVVL